MELKDLIEAASLKIGSQKRLAEQLGVLPTVLTNAKAGQRGLSPYACLKLAEILDIDSRGVIAASELVTERNESKRAYYAPFAKRAAAQLAVALGIFTLFVNVPPEAQAKPSPERVSSNANANYAKYGRRRRPTILSTLIAGMFPNAQQIAHYRAA